jgi:hypothetical protein
MASETHRHCVGPSGDELGHLLVRRLAGARSRSVVPPVLVRDDRVPEIRDPARAGRPLDGRADEVNRGAAATS